MPAPRDPEDASETRQEEEEIILRLSDILPRVPAHLLKPGPHDTRSQVRFSVEELAEKISRGRASVPLDRLASVLPDVFQESNAFPGEQEIPLPLQKLLEQVGLVAPKPPAPNGIPSDQVARAREEAGRIIQSHSEAPGPLPSRPAPSAPAANPSVLPSTDPIPAPPPPPAGATTPTPSVHASGLAKAFSTARQFLGMFGRPSESAPPPVDPEKSVAPKPPVTETASLPPVSTKPPQTPNADPPAPPPGPGPAEPPPQPAALQPIPDGCISVRLLPIFRLLPSEVLRSGTPPADDQRIALPLATIDPQLAGGHVEIPIEDFIMALPEAAKSAVNPVPGTQVWIPLDEIFQNLPPDHLFHMPPLDPLPEPLVSIEPEPAPEPAIAEQKALPADPEPSQPAAPVQIIAEKAERAPAEVIPPSTPLESEPSPVSESTPPPPPAPTDLPIENAPPAEALPEPEAAEATAGQPDPPADPIPSSPAADLPATTPEPAPPAADRPLLPTEPAPPAAEVRPPTPEPTATPQPSRAPWMHGFLVPPPRLFSGGTQPQSPTLEPIEPSTVEPPPPPPATPEAKRTADFLASQPGIFAAAAFVQGAVFASADFPRKPDLDALRDFMGTFIDRARDSGRRLGWNRILTISCEQFHLTAVVRDTHFVVALHHDRVLAPPTYDALIGAADELSKAAG